MLLVIVVVVLAVLYMRGASIEATTKATAAAAQPNTAATGTGATQGTANDETYNRVLSGITEALKLANKVADTQTQKY